MKSGKTTDFIDNRNKKGRKSEFTKVREKHDAIKTQDYYDAISKETMRREY